MYSIPIVSLWGRLSLYCAFELKYMLSPRQIWLLHSQSKYCRYLNSFYGYNVRFEHIFFLIEVIILEISFRKIVFVEDISSKFEFVWFLVRTNDGSNMIRSENSILEINVLQVIDPLSLEIWRRENIAEATIIDSWDCTLVEPPRTR